MNVRIETRCRKRTWLPRWLPGNVESHILVDDLGRDEAIGFAEECFALPHVFAVMVEMPGELYLLGGVRVVEA